MFDAIELGFERLIDDAKVGFHAAAAGWERGVRNEFDFTEAIRRADDFLHVLAERRVIFGVESEANGRLPGG